MNNYTLRLNALKEFYQSGATKSYDYRRQQLLKLKQAILKHEEELYKCLYTDLKKNKEEVWITETGFVISEINMALKNLRKLMRRKKTSTNLLNLPSSSYVLAEPLGVVLIIGPWNYPLQLLFTPLVGAIAAGNCIALKPTEFTRATTEVIKKIIRETFNSNYVLLIEGEGAVVIPEIIQSFRFNHIFFTGSTTTGKLIYKMAADNLVPVTLELGGKSPCIVEADADIKVAAKRIALAKFSNAGQMCVAPDYVLVHEKIKDKFLDILVHTIKQFFTTDAANSYDYGKIINEKHFERLLHYLQECNIIYGGKANKEKLFIEPTVVTIVSIGNSLMQEEIFGPVLPVISFQTTEQAKTIIEKNAEPLALYIYTSSKQKENFWLNNIAFGGGCINNCSMHLTNPNLPFGGRGKSGIGKYHGKYSFETFSHLKL